MLCRVVLEPCYPVLFLNTLSTTYDDDLVVYFTATGK